MLRTSIIFMASLTVMLAGCTEAPPNNSSATEHLDAEPVIDSVAATTEKVDMNEPEASAKFNQLNDFEKSVILEKGTERAGVGEYADLEDAGTYICRQCNAALYTSEHKFHSNCGWPAFDDEITGAVDRHGDADGYRVEIVCNNCQGHLGHVFEGERMTEKNIRHCVNSVSMKFIPAGGEAPAMIKKPTE
jgi:methionine-R-sulfoxide reductase